MRAPAPAAGGRLLLRPAAVHDGDRRHERVDVEIDTASGRLVGLQPRAAASQAAGGTALGAAVHELPGLVIAPALVDIQVNGGGGVMLNDQPSLEGLEKIVTAHRRCGVGQVMPTLISASPETAAQAAEAAVAAARDQLPGFAGLHLEGPHLAADKAGVHDRRLLRPMGDEDLRFYCRLRERLGELPLVVTVAPEVVEPAGVRALAAAGVIVSLGHSATGAEAAVAAIDAGATLVTHLFNAMSGLRAREPGLVGVTLTDPRVHAGMILDREHVAWHSARTAVAALGERLHLVSDALSCVGGGPQQFRFGASDVQVVDGVCQTDGMLAGGALPLTDMLTNTVAWLGLGLDEAVPLATTSPARALGLPAAGRLRPGGHADLIALSASGETRAIMMGGAWLEHS